MTRYADFLPRLPRLPLLLLAAAAAACSGPAPRQYPLRTPQAASAVPSAPDNAAKGDPEARFQAALKLMKDKQPQEAKEAFAALAKDFPQYAGPLNDLGVLQAQGKQRDQAIASFAAATAADGRNAFAWGWLGILYRENGDYARAEQAYLKAVAVRPDDAVAHLNLGILYEVYLKRPAQALAQYREYQRVAGDGNLVVDVWVRQLEGAQPRPTSVAQTGGDAGADGGAP